MNCRESPLEPMSRITCAVDTQLAPLVCAALGDMALPEVFVHRCKEMVLEVSRGFLGLRPSVALVADRAEFYRFCVPTRYEEKVMERVAAAADLYLPGRGSIYAEDVTVRRADQPEFLEDLLKGEAGGKRGGGAGSGRIEQHAVLTCIVGRGMAEPLARAVLEMGLCVPIVSFGEGVGLRNRLGLLRITVPVDKEVIDFIVPERDAALLESLVVHKARLDRPGRGFFYRFRIRAGAVNLRVHRGQRSHAASMEQVIAALDEIQGSSQWRRFSPLGKGTKPGAGEGEQRDEPQRERADEFACISIVAEEGAVSEFVTAAMDAGARGATLMPLEYRTYAGDGKKRESHARETCKLVVPAQIIGRVMDTVYEKGLHQPEIHGIAECSPVQKVITYQR